MSEPCPQNGSSKFWPYKRSLRVLPSGEGRSFLDGRTAITCKQRGNAMGCIKSRDKEAVQRRQQLPRYETSHVRTMDSCSPTTCILPDLQFAPQSGNDGAGWGGWAYCMAQTLTALEELRVGGAGATDFDLLALRPLTRLTSLDLCDSPEVGLPSGMHQSW